MALVGNTIKIHAEFPNTIQNLGTMSNVKLKIYTSDFKLIETVSTVTKISDGVYEVDYTVTDKLMPEVLVYEVSGDVGTSTYLGRGQIPRELV